jgi:hypothetical protein
MNLLPLTNGIGEYFQNLGLDHLCLTQTLFLNKTEDVISSAINKMNQRTFRSCQDYRFILTIVPIFRQNLYSIIEGYTYLLIDTIQHEIEWLVPFTFELEPQYRREIQKAVSKINVDYALTEFNFQEIHPQDLTLRMIENPQFLTIYYLQTRLSNPGYNRNQIILALRQANPETIVEYRKELIPFAYPQLLEEGKKGVIFCHGQTYQYKNIPNWVPRDAYWTMVDTNEKTNPHLIGDFESIETLSKLGFFQWDYVLFQNCPTYGSSIRTHLAFRSARWLLKPGGKIFYPKGLTSTFFLIEKERFKIGIEAESVTELIRAYHQKKVPQIDEFFERVKEEEIYKEYIPHSRRDVIMVV